jgi:hypothetical protein
VKNYRRKVGKLKTGKSEAGGANPNRRTAGDRARYSSANRVRQEGVDRQSLERSENEGMTSLSGPPAMPGKSNGQGSTSDAVTSQQIESSFAFRQEKYFDTPGQ